MPKNEKPHEAIDWGLATWEGSRRETLRRWAQLPLERITAALEEMQELSDMLFSKSTADGEATNAEPLEHTPRALQAGELLAGEAEDKNLP